MPVVLGFHFTYRSPMRNVSPPSSLRQTSSGECRPAMVCTMSGIGLSPNEWKAARSANSDSSGISSRYASHECRREPTDPLHHRDQRLTVPDGLHHQGRQGTRLLRRPFGRLSDVDLAVLEQIIRESYEFIESKSHEGPIREILWKRQA